MGMNWKIVGGAATVTLGLVLFAPGAVAAAAPLLIFAACPLSMRVMMRRTHDPATLREDGDASRAAIARLRSEVETLRHQQLHDPDGRT